jgi:hypothetical protein
MEQVDDDVQIRHVESVSALLTCVAVHEARNPDKAAA